MNETELDRLLDTWAAPPPPPSLRKTLRRQFSRADRRTFGRPLRWFLVATVVSATLVIGFGQSGGNAGEFPLVRILDHMYEHFLQAMDTWQVAGIRNQIRQSDPKVYVDGRLVEPLQYGGGARMDVRVPGDGVYSFVVYAQGPKGWVEAGRIQGSVIEFQAGNSHVRIECSRPVVDEARPVFVRRRP